MAKKPKEPKTATLEPEKPKNVGGRPSTYSPEIAAEICAQMATGISLRTICKAENLPALSTIFMWLSKHPVFAEQYALARETRADAIFEEILDISDDGSNDWMEQNSEGNAGWKANGEHIQRSRLRVDARKWMAARMAPKKYGDKSALEVTGKDGAALVPSINVTIGNPEPSSSS